MTHAASLSFARLPGQAEITLDQDKTYGKAKLIPPFLNTLSVQKYVVRISAWPRTTLVLACKRFPTRGAQVQEFQNASSVTILLRANQTKASIQIGRFGEPRPPRNVHGKFLECRPHGWLVLELSYATHKTAVAFHCNTLQGAAWTTEMTRISVRRM